MLRTDTNESVVLETTFFRATPDNIEEALGMFAVISAANVRTRRHFMHVRISPDHPLTQDEVGITLGHIEDEFRIANGHPRIVVKHKKKGKRADHFHVVWPIVNPTTGRAIASDENYLKDETVSRTLEVKFGERIIAGPRHEAVRTILEKRGIAAGNLDAPLPARGARFGGDLRQQAERLGVDIDAIGKRVYAAWRTQCDPEQFIRGVAKHGLGLAMGDRRIVVVDLATGLALPLARTLRAMSRAAGDDGLNVTEPQLRRSFPGLAPYRNVRESGLGDTLNAEARKADREFDRLAVEAKIDGQMRFARRLRELRAAQRAKDRAEFRKTLDARRKAIRAEIAVRQKLRALRVRRAFLIARIVDRPSVRKIVFRAAAAGWVLAGGGLGAALVVGGIALLTLPTRERARAAAFAATIERRSDWSERIRRLREAFAATRDELDNDQAAAADIVAQALDNGREAEIRMIARRFVFDETEPADKALVEAGADAALVRAVRLVMTRGRSQMGLRILGLASQPDTAQPRIVHVNIKAPARPVQRPSIQRDGGIGR